MFLFLHHFYFYHLYVFIRAVMWIARLVGNFIYNVHALYHFAEYSIVAVKMRCAADGLVHFTLRGGVFAAIAL